MKSIQIIAIQILIWCSIALVSCSNSDDAAGYKADFKYQMDTENPNMVTFTNVSEGEYLYVEWNFGNGSSTGKSTDKQKEHSVYFPKKGEYEVQLTVWGPMNQSSDTKVATQTIVIDADDPDYVNPENLVWSDEFNSASISAANWTFETGDHGWGNNELQMYTNGSNAHIEDGKLIITARKVNDNKQAGSYTSTRMISLGKREFTYGRFEIRAKLPSGTGVWPAIWMLGANINSVGWPACGEIDIMEYVGFEPNTVHATVHTPSGYAGNGNGSSKALETCEEDFHIYGIIWDEDKIQFYTDAPENITHTYSPAVKTAENWPFNKPHFFILNIAVGGSWGGVKGIDNNIFPQTMEIDYVRVYELDK
jgi:beta-glucanase (GH16 family)